MKKTFQAGHHSSKTTELYIHVANIDMNFIKNPLD